MEIIDLKCRNNEDFLLTLVGGGWWDIYQLPDVSLRLQVREPASSAQIYLDCSSDGETDQTISVDQTNKVLTVYAPASYLTGMLGEYQYDCRIIVSGNKSLLFGGTLTISQGVTRS